MASTMTAEQLATKNRNLAIALERRKAYMESTAASRPVPPSVAPAASRFPTTVRPNGYQQFRYPGNSSSSSGGGMSNGRWVNNRGRGGPAIIRPHYQRGQQFNGNAVVDWQSTVSVQVDLTIMDENFFAVKSRTYCGEVGDVCKSNPKKTYDPEKKQFLLPWSEYEDIFQKLSAIKSPGINVIAPTENIIRLFQNPPEKVQPEMNALCNLKSVFWDTLYDYQKECVMKGIEFGGRILIGDEMGLGKTVQALALAFYYREEWPLLIVCPSSVKGSWENSCERFMPGLCDVSSKLGGNTKSVRDVIILSYDSLGSKIKMIEQDKYHVIIFDESHMLKEKDAKRTKAGIGISKTCARVILCSGTPAVKGPIELFTQIKMINSSLFPNYTDYALAYCEGREGRYGFEAKGRSRCEELKAILEKFVMIRREKSGVAKLQGLPPKTRRFVYLEPSKIDLQMKELQLAQSKFSAKQNKDNMMEYFRTTAIIKSSAVTSYLEREYVSKHGVKDKLIIFGHHQVVLDTIGRMLDNNKIKFIRIDGSTQNRQDLVDGFQNDDKVRVALLSIGAAGVGITMTAAHIVIFTELYWNPSNLMQAEDRVHRIGQTHEVDVVYLLAMNTVDDHMLTSVRRKMGNLNALSLNTGSFNNVASTNEDTNRKISDFFEKIIDSAEEEPPMKINPRPQATASVLNTTIELDDDDGFLDDSAFEDKKKLIFEIDSDDSWADEEVCVISEKGNHLKRKPLTMGSVQPPKKSK